MTVTYVIQADTESLPAERNVSVYHGDTWSLAFQLDDTASTAHDLTGATAQAHAQDDTGADQAAIQATVGSDPTLGQITLTGALTPGIYGYDLAVTGPALAAPHAPLPSTTATGGTVASGVYTVATTYMNAAGETIASAAGTVTTTGTTSTITVPAPSAPPGATGWYAYVSQAGGSTLTRQQASPSAIGTALTLTAPPTSTGAAPPAANTTGTSVTTWVRGELVIEPDIA